MDVISRFHGAPDAIFPGYEVKNQQDGFTITVPVGFTVTVNPLHPPLVEQVNQPDPDPVEQVNQAEAVILLTQQITESSQHRTLSQSEVLFLLQNDSIPLLDKLQRTPRNDIFMYPMSIFRNRDGHDYDRSHIASDVVVDGILVKYRWSVVVNFAYPNVSVRRYHLENGSKFLMHYLEGPDTVDDPDHDDPVIPVEPVLVLG